MSFVQQQKFSLRCDKCGAALRSDPMTVAISTRTELHAAARDKGWYVSPSRDYCPACAERMRRATAKWSDG